jgi:hypothetical protein
MHRTAIFFRQGTPDCKSHEILAKIKAMRQLPVLGEPVFPDSCIPASFSATFF